MPGRISVAVPVVLASLFVWLPPSAAAARDPLGPAEPAGGRARRRWDAIAGGGDQIAGTVDGAIPGGGEAHAPETGGAVRGGGGCVEAEGDVVEGSDVLEDAGRRASVRVEPLSGCLRRYTLTTTAPPHDGQPANPRVVDEVAGAPRVRSNNRLFDALYALALAEMRENSVASIHDPAFNHGEGMQCPPGGCFETGRLWHYVWTRDTAYAVALGLGALDPMRARNSLLFKTSERRGGGREVVQDTGTGGSYPVSSDRVVWAIGAAELLKYLDGRERQAFADTAYEVAANTIAHDRHVLFDEADGLYRGEESFLDWREQSYPSWTADDPAQIGMSEALGTNVGHYAMLRLATRLAAERGDAAAASRYRGFARDLGAAIRARFRLADGSYSSFIPGILDPAPSRRSDLLSSALVVLYGLGTPEELARVVASYPHLRRGAPVIWPQQPKTPIYHNRAVWPFVTAFWLRAARKVDNAAAVDNGVASIMRSAALSLSNMENFEMVSGDTWVDDGRYSGPVVDSQRQLWSIAAAISMVHDVFFGLEASAHGIRFRPYVTKRLRRTLFAGSDSLVLAGFPYKGKRLTVVVHLPPVSSDTAGAYAVGHTELNGVEQDAGFLRAPELEAENRLDITLLDRPGRSSTIRLLDDAAAEDEHSLFAPRAPVITEVRAAGEALQLRLDLSGEAPTEVTLDIYRDGACVARDLPGTTTVWRDAGATEHASRTYCYAAESVFRDSGNVSQRARPVCYWGPSNARIVDIPASELSHTGGVPAVNPFHYEGWGDPGDELWKCGLTPPYTGRYLVQALAANGAGPVSSGITCAVKLVEVREEPSGSTQRGYLVMPQLGSWNRWVGSSFVPVTLEAGKRYRITLKHDHFAVNMSAFDHFRLFTGGTGGDGPYNRVSIAALKLLYLGP